MLHSWKKTKRYKILQWELNFLKQYGLQKRQEANKNK